MWRIVLLFVPVFVSVADGVAPVDEPKGPLTLRDAIGLALAGSPRLAPYPFDLRIGDARVLQARLRPNPEVSLELENIQLGDGARRETTTQTVGVQPVLSRDSLTGSGEESPLLGAVLSRISGEGRSGEIERESQSGAGVFGSVEMTLSLSQLIELGGKRAARIAVAERERAVLEWDYEVARFEVVGDAVTRFAETLAAQERLNAERQVVELAGKLSEAVSRLVEAGSVSPLEARRAAAEAELARVNLRERERELEQARLRLAVTWGSTQPRFTEAVGDFAHIAPVPQLEELLARRDRHPMLKRWAAELERRGAIIARERSKRIPDLTLRLGYRATAVDEGGARSLSLGTEGVSASRTRSGGDDWEHSLVLEASMPLPVRDRNQGGILEAQLDEEKLGAERRAWDAELKAAVAESYAQAQASAERFEALSSRVLPEMEATSALTREGYERGKFDFLAVLDAQRTVVDTRLALSEARIAYHLSIAELERLLGAGIVSDFSVPSGQQLDLQTIGKESNHEQ